MVAIAVIINSIILFLDFQFPYNLSFTNVNLGYKLFPFLPVIMNLPVFVSLILLNCQVAILPNKQCM